MSGSRKAPYLSNKDVLTDCKTQEQLPHSPKHLLPRPRPNHLLKSHKPGLFPLGNSDHQSLKPVGG